MEQGGNQRLRQQGQCHGRRKADQQNGPHGPIEGCSKLVFRSRRVLTGQAGQNDCSDGNAGSVSWLRYSVRLSELPLGGFGIAIATVILPRWSREHAGASGEQVAATPAWA